MVTSKTLSLPLALLLLVFSTFPTPSFAQATVSTGSIVGTLSDPSGALIIGATVTISSVATGQAIEITTSSSGTFNLGPLVPGKYKILVSVENFISAETTVTVLIGNTTTVNLKLQIGDAKEVVEVPDSAAEINTEQATVEGVLNKDQIDNLPINGRNWLDLAQLEPGVQIQDAANFGFGKDGFSSISLAAVLVALHESK